MRYVKPDARIRGRAVSVAAVALAVGLGLCTLAPADIIYVNWLNEGNTESGTWAQPYGTIQEAIDAASSGDTVVVAEGTYTDQRQGMNAVVEIDGDTIFLTATDTVDPSAYIITGDTDDDDDGDVPVIAYTGTITDGAVIGFTMEYGLSGSSGGAVSGVSSVFDGSTVGALVDVKHCVFQNNFASNLGGALAYIVGDVMHCTFAANTAGASGGAASNYEHALGTFADNLVYENTGGSGAVTGVGGVQGYEYVYRNEFQGNEGTWGSAIDVCKYVANNRVYDNVSTYGAIANSLYIYNNTVYGNSVATGEDGVAGIYLTDVYFSGASPIVRNNIVWDNSDDNGTSGQQIGQYQTVDVTVTNCCIDESANWDLDIGDVVENNVFDDPDLLDPATPDWDFHLTDDSTACIDAAYDLYDESDTTGLLVDFEGEDRDSGVDWDIGVDEYEVSDVTWDSDYSGWNVYSAGGGYEIVNATTGYYLHPLLPSPTTHCLLYHSVDTPDARIKFRYNVDDFTYGNSYGYFDLRRDGIGVTSIVRLRFTPANTILALNDGTGWTNHTNTSATNSEDTWYEIEAVCDGSDVTVWRRPLGGTWSTLFDVTGTVPTDSDSVWCGAMYGCEMKFACVDVEGLDEEQAGPGGWITYSTGGGYEVVDGGGRDFYMRLLLPSPTTHCMLFHPFDIPDSTITFKYNVDDFTYGSSYGYFDLRRENTDSIVRLRFTPANTILALNDGTGWTNHTNTSASHTEDTWYEIEAVCDGEDVTVKRRPSGGAWTTIFTVTGSAPVDSSAVWCGAMYGCQMKFDDINVVGLTERDDFGSAGGPAGADSMDSGLTDWDYIYPANSWAITDTGEDDNYVTNTADSATMYRDSTTFGNDIGSDVSVYFSYRGESFDKLYDSLFCYFRKDPWSSGDYLRLDIRPGSMGIMQKTSSGTISVASDEGFTSKADTWYDVKILCDGTSVKVWRREQGKEWKTVFDVTVGTTAADIVQFATQGTVRYRVDDMLIFNDPSF